MKRFAIALLASTLALPFAFAAQDKPADQQTTQTKGKKKKAEKKPAKSKSKTKGTTAKPSEPTAK